MTVPALRHLRLSLNTAELRTATFEGRSHIIVPVVALVANTVVRPLGSTGPEYVPAATLAATPSAWNNRPVLQDHPVAEDGTPISANDPTVLERECFGRMFHTEFTDGRLRPEAWIDLARADAIGGETAKVCADLQSGDKIVEVSVGAFVDLIESPGIAPDGSEYERYWGSLVPDHLAIGLSGHQGACSVDGGCGAPRVNKGEPVAPPLAPTPSTLRITTTTETAMTDTPEPNTDTPTPEPNTVPSILSRLLGAISFGSRDDSPLRPAQDEGVSDVDLRDSLWKALRADEPGFIDILEVFPGESVAIYITAPEETLLYFRRSYTANDEGEVTLAEAKEQVEPVTEYQSVAATAHDEDDSVTQHSNGEGSPLSSSSNGEGSPSPSSAAPRTSVRGVPATTAARSGCQCPDPAACTCHDKGEQSMSSDNTTQLVDGLIALEDSPFTEEDRQHLEGFPEERLQALTESLTPALTQDPSTSDTGDPPPDSPNPLTDEEQLASLPEAVRAAVRRDQAAQAAELAAHVMSIRSATQEYSEEELRAMPISALAKLSKALKVTPEPTAPWRPLPTGSTGPPEVPKPYDLALGRSIFERPPTTN